MVRQWSHEIIARWRSALNSSTIWLLLPLKGKMDTIKYLMVDRVVSCLERWEKFAVKFKNVSQSHGWQFANSWIYILIIHWSPLSYLQHDWLLPFVSFNKTHSLRCPSKRCFEWWLIVFISCFVSYIFKYCYKLCIRRQMVVTHIFYFMHCQSSLLSTVISFA